MSIHGICLSKDKLSFTMGLLACLCILFVMGEVMQNPGPPRHLSSRAGANTRTRASCLSLKINHRFATGSVYENGIYRRIGEQRRFM